MHAYFCSSCKLNEVEEVTILPWCLASGGAYCITWEITGFVFSNSLASLIINLSWGTSLWTYVVVRLANSFPLSIAIKCILGKPIHSFWHVGYFVVSLFLPLLMSLESSGSLLVLNGVTTYSTNFEHRKRIISNTSHCYEYCEHRWCFFIIEFYLLFIIYIYYSILWVCAIVTRASMWSLLVMSLNLCWYIIFPRSDHIC